ncbi:MAG: hypothetical protein AAGG48_07895 [Planctomycetota bacterium]
MCDEQVQNHSICWQAIRLGNRTPIHLVRVGLPANNVRPFRWIYHGWKFFSSDDCRRAMRLVYMDRLEALQSWYNLGLDHTYPVVRGLEHATNELRTTWGFSDQLSHEDQIRVLETAIKEHTGTLKKWSDTRDPDPSAIQTLRSDLNRLRSQLRELYESPKS